jgi:hypothetical protein
MRSTSFLACVLVAALATPAVAQTPPTGTPTPIRGTVEKLDDHTLTVKLRDGGMAAVTLAPTFTVRTVVAKTLEDIKPGDYVASTSIKSPDGTLQAIEVHIFPEKMRGAGEGQIPWDLVPNSLMTNATVAKVTGVPQGRVMKVTFKGKESEIIVPSGIPIVAYGPGDVSLLKPGTTIFVFARKQPDGSLTAGGVTAEKDGVKPPM